MAASSSTLPPDPGERSWYLSKKEIEENSPSRRDGIDLKNENCLRMYYSTFLQDMSKNLGVSQTVTATAIIFCHRFFLRQSHANNDWKTVATSCMFLATKVEENRHFLKDVILASYKTRHYRAPDEVQKIIAPEAVYEQKRDLILAAEMLVLDTLNYDLQVDQPYDILVNAKTEFQVNNDLLISVARKIVTDGLRTSLWLQLKPNQLAVCAMLLAGKFINVEIQIDGEKPWWPKFHVTSVQVAEFCEGIMELYESQQKFPSQPTEAEQRVGGAQLPPVLASAMEEQRAATRNVLIEKARELKESMLSDKAKAERETIERKRAIIEERKRAHGAGKLLPPEKKTKSEKDSKNAS